MRPVFSTELVHEQPRLTDLHAGGHCPNNGRSYSWFGRIFMCILSQVREVPSLPGTLMLLLCQ